MPEGTERRERYGFRLYAIAPVRLPRLSRLVRVAHALGHAPRADFIKSGDAARWYADVGWSGSARMARARDLGDGAMSGVGEARGAAGDPSDS